MAARDRHRSGNESSGEEQNIRAEIAQDLPGCENAAPKLGQAARQNSQAYTMQASGRDGCERQPGMFHKFSFHAVFTTDPKYFDIWMLSIQSLEHGEGGVHAAAGSTRAD